MRILKVTFALVATALLVTAPAAAADTGSLKLAQATTVGVHNTYSPDAYGYLAQALDSGTSMVELDAWDNVLTRTWQVSHDNPVGNDNNCVNASTAADLYTGNRNQNLGACLSDIRVWLGAHPGGGPIFVKLELKAGFQNNLGMGPDELDSYIKANTGNTVFRPADLLGSSYSTLDAAARADAWPSRDALAGKMVIEVIPGTVELANPTDSLHTDIEYATYLKNLYSAGDVGNAMIFPSVLGAVSGDPRTQYSDTSIRPWFVFFDGDASKYVDGGIDTSWYDTNHYILIMTDSHLVSPAISDTTPSVDEATARVQLLAAHHASIASSDWTTLTTVLPQVLPRG